ncbi:MAG: phosphate acyltransferase PlsX [Thermodesulfovibrionia bacterium]
MRIALDAMGGDYAPVTNIEGAIEAVKKIKDISVILVGQEAEILKELKKRDYPHPQISIKHASERVGMDESPISTLRRKKDSSIRIAFDLVRRGEADAVVSAGNSGVVMATALYVLGRIPGIERPAIATTMPSLKGRFVLIDAGANVDCKPHHMVQFAIMGEAYAKHLLNINDPKIGLLGIGEEDIKGNELTRVVLKHLRSLHKNFIGNVEGKDIYLGDVDVVVCDGFVGNIALKISEGVAEAMTKMLKAEIKRIITGKIGYLLLKSAFRSFKKRTDYSEYGGAPLLGVPYPCIIGHGRSTSRAIKNAIKVAVELHQKKVVHAISQEFSARIDWRAQVAVTK